MGFIGNRRFLRQRDKTPIDQRDETPIRQRDKTPIDQRDETPIDRLYPLALKCIHFETRTDADNQFSLICRTIQF